MIMFYCGYNGYPYDDDYVWQAQSIWTIPSLKFSRSSNYILLFMRLEYTTQVQNFATKAISQSNIGITVGIRCSSGSGPSIHAPFYQSPPGSTGEDGKPLTNASSADPATLASGKIGAGDTVLVRLMTAIGNDTRLVQPFAPTNWIVRFYNLTNGWTQDYPFFPPDRIYAIGIGNTINQKLTWGVGLWDAPSAQVAAENSGIPEFGRTYCDRATCITVSSADLQVGEGKYTGPLNDASKKLLIECSARDAGCLQFTGTAYFQALKALSASTAAFQGAN
jgi:hypothetical protein